MQAVFDSLSSASYRQRGKAQLQHFHAQICLFHDGWNNIFGVVVLRKDGRKLEDFYREVERTREELCVADRVNWMFKQNCFINKLSKLIF